MGGDEIMACAHKRLRCTDCAYYCLDCGARVDPPTAVEAATGATSAATERAKRKAKKEAGKK